MRLRVADDLLHELDEARDTFLDVLADVDVELVTVPGVMGDWSVRDLVVHVAAWAEHGTAALELAAAGRGGEFSYSRGDTDAMNEGFLAEARQVSPSAALAREETAFGAFRARVVALDPSLRDMRLGNGDTVTDVVRYDGPEHYVEHTTHLRDWFSVSDDDEE